MASSFDFTNFVTRLEDLKITKNGWDELLISLTTAWNENSYTIKSTASRVKSFIVSKYGKVPPELRDELSALILGRLKPTPGEGGLRLNENTPDSIYVPNAGKVGKPVSGKRPSNSTESLHISRNAESEMSERWTEQEQLRWVSSSNLEKLGRMTSKPSNSTESLHISRNADGEMSQRRTDQEQLRSGALSREESAYVIVRGPSPETVKLNQLELDLHEAKLQLKAKRKEIKIQNRCIEEKENAIEEMKAINCNQGQEIDKLNQQLQEVRKDFDEITNSITGLAENDVLPKFAGKPQGSVYEHLQAIQKKLTDRKLDNESLQKEFRKMEAVFIALKTAIETDMYLSVKDDTGDVKEIKEILQQRKKNAKENQDVINNFQKKLLDLTRAMETEKGGSSNSKVNPLLNQLQIIQDRLKKSDQNAKELENLRKEKEKKFQIFQRNDDKQIEKERKELEKKVRRLEDRLSELDRNLENLRKEKERKFQIFDRNDDKQIENLKREVTEVGNTVLQTAMKTYETVLGVSMKPKKTRFPAELLNSTKETMDSHDEFRKCEGGLIQQCLNEIKLFFDQEMFRKQNVDCLKDINELLHNMKQDYVQKTSVKRQLYKLYTHITGSDYDGAESSADGTDITVRDVVQDIGVRFKKQHDEMEEEIKRLSHNNQQISNQLQDVYKENEKLTNELKKIEEQKVNLLNRLSKLAGAADHSNIADIGDPNRPTKLAEKYCELYDNQWTDAYERLTQADGHDEKHAISVLLTVLKESYVYCVEKSGSHKFAIKTALICPAQSIESSHVDNDVKLGPIESKMVSDLRKQTADKSYLDIQTHFLRSKETEFDIKAGPMMIYTSMCIELCWIMCLQSPPVVIEFEAKEKFDDTLFKFYQKQGKKLDYVVWPPLYLQKKGSLLSKGVAEGKK